MAHCKIPDSLVPDLCRMSAEAKSVSEMVIWLFEVHGIKITDQAIRKRLKRVQLDRAPLVQAIVADKLQHTVAEDLDSVRAAMSRALEDELESRDFAKGLAHIAPTEENPNGADLRGSDIWGRVMHVVRTSRGDLMHLLALSLKLSGADEHNGKKADTEAVREQLMSKVDQLLAQAGHKEKISPESPLPHATVQ